MAHLLPPAGITYPESDRFRNYLVRPPMKNDKSNCMTICCEMNPMRPPGCRQDVRCKLVDGQCSIPIKVCPDCSDVITGFVQKEDCRPRSPLTQPGLLCYSGCEESQGPKRCRPSQKRRNPCPPHPPPCPPREPMWPPPSSACPPPCPMQDPPCPKKTMRTRPCSAGEARRKPRLVKETHITQEYMYE